MDDLASQIYDLIQSKGKSAKEITHGLASIGDGKMEVGIKRLADFYDKTGEKRGLVKGICGSITIASISYYLIKFIKKKINENKEYEAEGKAILRALEEAPDDSTGYSITETSGKDKTGIHK